MLINLFVPPSVHENRPIIRIKIKQDNYLFLIDTGFTINVISEELKERLLQEGQLTLSQVSPSTRIYGGSEVKTLDLYMWKSETFENPMKTAISGSVIPRLKKENAGKKLDGILGMEFINQFNNISLIFPNFIADLNTKKYPSDYRLFNYVKDLANKDNLVIKSDYDPDLRAFVIEDLPVVIDTKYNNKIRGIFDTGADVTVLSYALYKKLGKPAFKSAESFVNIGGSRVRGKYVAFKVPLLSDKKEFNAFIITNDDVNKNASLAMEDIEALIGMDIFMNLPKSEIIKMRITNNDLDNVNNSSNSSSGSNLKKRKLLEIFHKKS